MNNVACKGNGNGTPRCQYDSSWFCKNPKCKQPVLTSTLFGARPSGCPIEDKWNRKDGENEKDSESNRNNELQ